MRVKAQFRIEHSGLIGHHHRCVHKGRVRGFKDRGPFRVCRWPPQQWELGSGRGSGRGCGSGQLVSEGPLMDEGGRARGTRDEGRGSRDHQHEASGIADAMRCGPSSPADDLRPLAWAFHARAADGYHHATIPMTHLSLVARHSSCELDDVGPSAAGTLMSGSCGRGTEGGLKERAERQRTRCERSMSSCQPADSRVETTDPGIR